MRRMRIVVGDVGMSTFIPRVSILVHTPMRKEEDVH
jgi:hypothetical protein